MRLRLWTVAKLFPPEFLLLLLSWVLLLKNTLLLKVPSHHKVSPQQESGGSKDRRNTLSQNDELLLVWQEVTLCLVTQLCLTLCDPMFCSPPDSSVHGILQARILEWAAMATSRGSSQPRDWGLLHCILYRLSHQGSPRSHSILLITEKQRKIL